MKWTIWPKSHSIPLLFGRDPMDMWPYSRKNRWPLRSRMASNPATCPAPRVYSLQADWLCVNVLWVIQEALSADVWRWIDRSLCYFGIRSRSTRYHVERNCAINDILKFSHIFVRFDKGFSPFIFISGVPPIVAVQCRYKSWRRLYQSYS